MPTGDLERDEDFLSHIFGPDENIPDWLRATDPRQVRAVQDVIANHPELEYLAEQLPEPQQPPKISYTVAAAQRVATEIPSSSPPLLPLTNVETGAQAEFDGHRVYTNPSHRDIILEQPDGFTVLVDPSEYLKDAEPV